MSTFRLLVGDCREMLRTLPDESVHCVVTSPPYWGLRDYGHDDQLGLEPTPELYVERMVEVFREVRRVLRSDGTLWLNLGDSYAAQRGGTHQPAETLAGAKGGRTQDGQRVNRGRHDGYNPSRNAHAIGLKHKDLVGIPWRVAFALQADGWYLRSDIIWAKPNPMPESVRDRPTKAHEYVFLLSKSERYYYDADAIKEPLATDPRENYPARARITGRGNQGAAAARGNDRDKSGGFPPRRSGNKARKYGEDRNRPGSHLGAGVPWEDDGTGRNARSVWTITTRPYPGAHFATFPPELAEKCILAGCPKGGTVLDPFAGSGTTGMVATGQGRNAILIELNPRYAELIRDRIGPMLETIETHTGR